MSATLRNLHLLDLCAPSLSYDRQVQAACGAVDNQLHEIIDVTDGTIAVQTTDAPAPPPAPPEALSAIIFIPQIMRLADEKLVDILAWQFHVDFYDHTLPLATRKQLVQNSIMWHHRKGTVALVQEVLDTFWRGGATLIEWYEYMDPLPPNYPTNDPDSLAVTFNEDDVSVSNDRWDILAHGLTNNTQVRFVPTLAFGSRPPTPLAVGLWYWVVNATTNHFQVSQSIGGTPVDLTDTGVGSNQIYKKGLGTWHDRYRFRVIIDERVITPDDERRVIELIEAYKPVSRWLDGFVRAIVSDCNIGVTGAMLRFVYRSSEEPIERDPIPPP